MNLKELMIAAFAVTAIMSTHPTQAFADGPVSAYDGEEDLALSPNEQAIQAGQINADGAVEDPSGRMSGTARAFRNGRIQGAAEQKDKDAQAVPPLPPLPPNMQQPQPKGYAGYPQAAQVAAIPQPAVRQMPVYAPVQQQPEVAYQPPPQQYVRAPQPPVVVNVVQPDPRYYEPADQYARAPSWRNRQEAMEEYGYDPYPPPGYQVPPRPVYIQPYQPQPVYVQPPPVIVAQGYVPRMMPAYPYGGGSAYVGYSSRRGWSVGYRGW